MSNKKNQSDIKDFFGVKRQKTDNDGATKPSKKKCYITCDCEIERIKANKINWTLLSFNLDFNFADTSSEQSNDDESNEIAAGSKLKVHVEGAISSSKNADGQSHSVEFDVRVGENGKQNRNMTKQNYE